MLNKPVHQRLPDIIQQAINIPPIEVLKSQDYILVYNDEGQIKNIRADRKIFAQVNFGPAGVDVTAKGNKVDFISGFLPHRLQWTIL